MARPPSTTGGRPEHLSLRLSPAEAKALDQARGNLSRSMYVRTLLGRQTRPAGIREVAPAPAVEDHVPAPAVAATPEAATAGHQHSWAYTGRVYKFGRKTEYTCQEPGCGARK